MLVDSLISFKLPPEFVEDVLAPWQGPAGLQLRELILRTFTASCAPEGGNQMLERNQQWRQAFKEKFEQIFGEMCAYGRSLSFERGVQEGIGRMEAWMCVTNRCVCTRSWREQLLHAAVGEAYVQRCTEESMRQLSIQFGTPRRYRTPWGLDQYYLRIERAMTCPGEAGAFAAKVWYGSGWIERITQVLQNLLGPCGLIPEFNTESILSIKESTR